MIKVSINGKAHEFENGISAGEIAKAVSVDALAVKIDNKVLDLTTTIDTDTTLELLDFNSKEGKDVFWHSASHIMTQAVLRIFKDQNIGLGVGVPTEDGFYQDYDIKELHPEDLKKIEKEMYKIVKEKLEITQKTIPKSEALDFYKNDPYKTELANAVPGDQVSMYCQGEFENLCKGPHVPNTSYIKAYKLTKIAGAYWRGDANNKQLTRIYGVAFPTKEQLKEYMRLLEEAKKRDHRKLGKQLKLFSFHDEGTGFPFWHPKGLFIFNKLIDVWRQMHKEAGYVEIKTPIILSKSLWERSGHWSNYGENMYYTTIDGEEHAIKPMNCPGAMLMYNESVHSYRELPLRVGEIGLVHRHELSGVLSGLFRVRQFHQDDAHIYMTEAQMKEEILGVINLTDKLYSMFDLPYHMELSTRPDKCIGTDEQWEKATKALKDALDSTGKEYFINEGDGAFYGPKIDFHIKDALGRTWQCATIQLDMAQPDNFDLTYMGEDGNDKHRPVMIHRTIYGALERFIGILIEHYAGKLPMWLSPVQVKILTVSEKFEEYAKKVATDYEKAGIRIELDMRSETLSKKVREAQLEKVNYILVVGENEVKNNTVTVRTRENEVLGERSTEDFKRELTKAGL